MTFHRGFTLMEMMVVVAIALMMMVMIVPIFTVTTRTVATVERKLIIYQAARNIIDQLENDVAMAAINERGDAFNIKSVTYVDTDKNPIISPEPPSAKNPFPPDPLAYRMSNRYACAINVMKYQGGGFRWADGIVMPGSQAFANACPEFFTITPEAWKVSIRSTLLYGQWTNPNQDLVKGFHRTEQLQDVGRIRLQLVNNALYMRSSFGSDVGNRHYDQLFDDTAPGYEIKAAGDRWTACNDPYRPEENAQTSEDPNRLAQGLTSADMYYQIQRVSGEISLMDFDVAYWDDTARTFKRVPDGTMISFSPPPKAVRFTVTVCDRDKRMLLTLCRVTRVAVGTGLCGDVSGGTAQLNLEAKDILRMDTDPAPFNRTKKLSEVEPELYWP